MNKTTINITAFACLVLILLNVYTSGTLTDNLEEGNTVASLLNDLKGDIAALDVQESTLKEAVIQCINDVDCYNAGKCTELKDGLKVCECRNGTSGALCQNVDECVADPDKCGNGTDVQCVFDVIQEEAICKCDNASKQFDYYTETCMVPCKTFSNCAPNGYCFKNEKSKLSKYYFCRCKPGARGDFCEIIDQCQSKEVDCGSDPGVICALGKNGQAYCKCKDTKQGFDFDNKICKKCDCGQMAISCNFIKDGKKCSCKEKYIPRTSFYARYGQDTRCDECDCGEHGECSFEDDEKQCTCEEHYLLHSGKCEKCFCGPHGTCKFDDGDTEPICTCDYGYAVQDGICVNIDECFLGGTCVSATTLCVNTPGSYDCVCREGYYATAAVQGDTYMPMYNACYGKETQWKAAAITLAVILVIGRRTNFRNEFIQKKTEQQDCHILRLNKTNQTEYSSTSLGTLDGTIPVSLLPPPSCRKPITLVTYSNEVFQEYKIICFIDGSKLNGRVDLACVIYEERVENVTFQHRLRSECLVSQAQLLYINLAIKKIQESPSGRNSQLSYLH
ncbi:uncharacterized protein TNIN_384701 [Trichonephila inaurata madagascariensis]|uniref:EGF-like domain-containing protein n=1 Tax=Trichonephila inaurata madagascariensis TaxID=2747483 RepID=A0A8X6XGH0_9ARAC|nr:uncharacterized protein TNIN_384701 [Trichonephila inaurata madagascariensis]